MQKKNLNTVQIFKKFIQFFDLSEFLKNILDKKVNPQDSIKLIDLNPKISGINQFHKIYTKIETIIEYIANENNDIKTTIIESVKLLFIFRNPF